MAGRTGTGVSAPPQVGATNGDYAIFFDPKASPTGIPFEVALAYKKAGRMICRAGREKWDTKQYDRYRDIKGSFPEDDLLANDWMVIPEKQ